MADKNEASNLYMEVPLVFPALEKHPLRFIVNDIEKTIVNESEWTTIEDVYPSSNVSTYYADESLLRGSASVSSLDNGATLTTITCVEQPWIVSLSLLSSSLLSDKSSLPPPPVAMIQLDLSRTQLYKDTVKIQAFDDGNKIRLVLIDSSGVILKIYLDPMTLVPDRKMSVTNLLGGDSPLLPEDMASMVASSCIRSTTIVFLSIDVILLSLHPFLVAVDIDQHDFAVWSQTKCLEEMKQRESTVGRFLAKSADLVLGKMQIRAAVNDMSPISALCVADNDHHLVFSLHSDGTVRRWTMKFEESCLKPWSVHELPLVQQRIPPSELWSNDGNHSTMMSARVYQNQVFVLAIHIQVATASTTSEEEEESDCRLVVVDGHLANEELSLIPLKVPVQATSLVGMSFEPQERCSLTALFQSVTDNNASSGGKMTETLYLVYPPSNLSIVGREPEQAPAEYFLDRVAWKESERIANLSFYGCLDLDQGLDDLLHEIDARFLKYLFRPAFPRGTGSVLPPSNVHIRRSLQKLVSNYNRHFAKTSMSVELEVLRAIHEWRNRDKRSHRQQIAFSMTPLTKGRPETPKTPGTDMADATSAMSFYDSLVPMDEDDDESGPFDAGLENEDDDDTDRDREAELKAHETRWRQLLMQIWEEEEVDRVPICLGRLTHPEPDSAILIRPGVISVAVKAAAVVEKGRSSENALSALDSTAANLIRAIEQDEDLSAMLREAEQEAWETVSSGQLALNPAVAYELFDEVASFSRSKVNEVTSGASSRLTDLINDLTNSPENSDIVALLEEPALSSSLPGLCLLSSGQGNEPPHMPLDGPVAGRQLRLSAAGLAVRCADSVRRVLLGRLLIMSVRVGTRLAIGTALRMYLNAVTVMWTEAQQIPLSRSTVRTKTSLPLSLSMSDDSPPKKRPSFSNDVSGILNSSDKTLVLDVQLMDASRRHEMDRSLQGGSSLSSAAVILVRDFTQTCFRPTMEMAGQKPFEQLPELGIISPEAKYHPKLALRLLASFCAFPRPNDSKDVIDTREELLAECLVLAANDEYEDKAREMASAAFKLMKFDENQFDRSMQRLRKISDHISKDNRMLSTLLLNFIESAIKRLDKSLPRDDLLTDASYISLWSTFFNTAVSIQDWEKAFVAWYNIPDPKRKASSFRRLVRAMVDGGFLSELLKKCASLSSDPSGDSQHVEAFSKCADLYGIAAESLAEAGLPDLYLLRATEEEPLSDYRAALYALHVSQGEWRRATQALDFLHVNARQALMNGPSVSGLDFHKAYKRESLIVDDLLLSSLGCHLAVGLITDEHARFIVSGEHGKYPSIPIYLQNREGQGYATKRIREPTSQTTVDVDQEKSRLSRYMNPHDLEARAARCSALSTLFYDRFAEPAVANIAFLAGADRDLVDGLFMRGYFSQGLMVSKVRGLAQGTKVEGYDVFYDSLEHLLRTYLVPLAVDPVFEPARPSEQQLCSAIDCLGEPSELPHVLVGSRSKKLAALPRASVRLGATSLLKTLTTRYSTAETPLAVVAAENLLTQKGTAALPPWLENFLLKGASNVNTPGLFAQRPKPGSSGYLGNPAALLRLYTKHGLYQDACRIVTTVLETPDIRTREKRAPGRLPEKGDIDFVPYDEVDLLWNLIDIAITSGHVDELGEREIKASRQKMEGALEKHFALLKISEMGQQSARALS